MADGTSRRWLADANRPSALSIEGERAPALTA
jgi:hypothetical protein